MVFTALEDGMPKHLLHDVLPEEDDFLSEEAELGRKGGREGGREGGSGEENENQ